MGGSHFGSQNAIHVAVPVIYIDQPIDTGFSYGTNTVNSTAAAAPFVWKAFQVLFESKLFSKYASRRYVHGSLFCLEIYSEGMIRFIFATESYGGRHGPSFVTYFEEQNALITSGAIEGEPIAVSALMINK